jgi:hypothetical protein
VTDLLAGGGYNSMPILMHPPPPTSFSDFKYQRQTHVEGHKKIATTSEVEKKINGDVQFIIFINI